MAPEKAFFPLRINKTGKIMPSYSWRECVKNFVFCLEWRKKTLYFENLEWFYANGYGLTKRKDP
jgi:hypothetical protein